MGVRLTDDCKGEFLYLRMHMLGYDFAKENRNLVDDLMEEILKEDVKPIGKTRLPKVLQ